MNFKPKIKTQSILWLSMISFLLLLTTLISSALKVEAQTYFYSVLLIATAVFLWIEVGTLAFFKASTYKRINLNEIVSIAIAVIGGILFLSGMIALPIWSYTLPPIIAGVMVGTNIVMTILAILSVLWVTFTE